MSRITKEIAEQVAKKMTEDKENEIIKINKQLTNTVTDFVLKTIPEEVIEFNEKFKGYIDMRSNVRLIGNGWNYENLSLSKSIPLKKQDFIPNVKQSDILKKLKEEVSDKEKHLQQLRRKIGIALYSLRTYSKVAIEFPEAVPFLPKKQETSLAININDIRAEL